MSIAASTLSSIPAPNHRLTASGSSPDTVSTNRWSDPKPARMPPVDIELVEEPEPDAPYGAKGVGEPPTVVSTAAILSALRNATGRPLTRVPVRPDDICL